MKTLIYDLASRTGFGYLLADFILRIISGPPPSIISLLMFVVILTMNLIFIHIQNKKKD